jgi:hypothetical protein
MAVSPSPATSTAYAFSRKPFANMLAALGSSSTSKIRIFSFTPDASDYISTAA